MNPSKAAFRRPSLLWRLSRHCGGTIAIEFALVAPLLVILLIGTVEAARYLILHLKAQHAAITVGDLITRNEKIFASEVQDIFSVVAQIMSPYPAGGGESRVIITAINKDEDENPEVFWQEPGGGTLSRTSIFGGPGDQVPLVVNGIPVRDSESIIAVEFYYRFESAYFQLYAPQTIGRIAYFRPRIGALKEVTPDS